MRARVVALGGDPADPDLAARAASALARGELVVLPTETVYGVAARMDHGEALEKLRTFKGGREDKPFTLHLADPADAGKWAAGRHPMAGRLAARYWPGPLTLVLPGREGEAVGLRVPARRFTREVIRACGVPLCITSANLGGTAPLWDAGAVAEQLGDRVDWIFDGGPSELREASTVVQVEEDRFTVLRRGILGEEDLAAAAGATVLFVCTGNTCRSPMAEAWLRHETARRLGCTPGELPRRGLVVRSAGLGAGSGEPPSPGAVLAMAEAGLDISGHRTRPLTAALLEGATAVYAMTAAHLERIAGDHPGHTEKLRLLSPAAAEIPDPFAGSGEDYRACRDAIASAVRARLDEMLALRGF